jgi:acyl-CoA-binding protein
MIDRLLVRVPFFLYGVSGLSETMTWDGWLGLVRKHSEGANTRYISFPISIPASVLAIA